MSCLLACPPAVYMHVCMLCCVALLCVLQVEQAAVDLEGEGDSSGFNTAEALRALLVKKGVITQEVTGQ